METQSHPCITFIADSNRSRITNHLREELKENPITETQNIYVTSDLVKLIKQAKTPDQKKTDLTIIMMGTNDVREGLGHQAEANIKELAEIMDQDTTIATEIPPIEIGRKGGEVYEEAKTQRGNLNKTIRKYFKNVAKQTETNIQQYAEGTMLDKGGFHLTPEGGRQVAEIIAQTVKATIENITKKPQTETQTPNTHSHKRTETPTETLTIPPGIGCHVIGKKGKTISDIKARNHVNIQTGNTNKDDQTELTITGNKKDIQSAIREISEIIDKHLDRQKTNETRKQEEGRKICRFFQEGYCKFGGECWQTHTSESRTDDRPRPNQSPQRKKTRPIYRDPNQNLNRPNRSRSRDARYTPKKPRQESPHQYNRQEHTRQEYRRQESPHHRRRENPNQHRENPNQHRENPNQHRENPNQQRENPNQHRDERNLMSNISDLVGRYLQGERN